MATVPAPKTWIAGEIVTAAYLNGVRDALLFLLARPYVSVRQSVAQSLASNTWAGITFTTEETDNDGMHSTGSNTSRLTAVTPGWYQVSGQVAFAANAAGSRNARLAVNGTAVDATGTTTLPGNGNIGVATIAARAVFLNAGDYVEIQGMQSSGGALNTSASGEYVSALTATWQSS